MEINHIGEFKQLYVYGYSNLGRNAYNKLKNVFQNMVKGIVVSRHNDKSKSACENDGKSILELSQIAPSADTLIIIALNPIHHSEIKQLLSEAGFKNIMVYDEKLDEELNSSLIVPPKLELRFLSVSVGQACNLKCKDCANFAPFALKGNRKYSIANVRKDLNKTLSWFSEVDTFHVQGGEPFLYSDLGELLYHCKSKFGHILKNIQVATNGTILPDESILEALYDTETIVRISNYPNQGNADKLVDALERKGISYRMYDFANRIGEWSFTGEMDYLELDDENLEEKVRHCAWNACYIIENGMVGRCARSIPARTLQAIKIREQDYIDLNQDYDMSEIGKYFMFIRPMDCCRHCKGSNGEPIPPAIQL